MKIRVEKLSFIKSWNLAERSTSSTGSMNIYSAIRIKAGEGVTELQATDVRTSIVCEAKGVQVLEPGEAIIPTKGVGDLFKKASAAEFTLEVDEGRAVMQSGTSRYRFSTYPPSEFPDLPSSKGGEVLCELTAKELSRGIERGTLAALSGDESPAYLSSVYFHIEGTDLRIVTTDNKRLAVSGIPIRDANASTPLLLQMRGVKELLRVLSMLDPSTVVRISFDDAQAYFSAADMEFAARRVESKFPAYQRVLPTNENTFAVLDRSALISALERVDVVVRDYNRSVIMRFSPGGDCTLVGRAPEFGEARETLSGEIEGESLRIGVNTRFFSDALKVLDDPMVRLSFNGPESQMAIREKNSDSFLCLVAPVGLGADDGDTEADS